MDYYLSEDNCYKRLENEFKKYGKLIFSVDFDDTIFDFHKSGRKYDDVISLLHRWENYSEVIIFTGAGEERYPEIEKYLLDNNIKYKGINCNSSIDTGGRKIYANVYIDDRGGLPLVYKMLDKLITKIEYGVFDNISKHDLVPLGSITRISKMIAIVDTALSEKTIIVSNKVYSEYIENKDKIKLMRYPFLNEKNIVNLSDLNIMQSSINIDICRISLDVAIAVDLDFGGDILSVITK